MPETTPHPRQARQQRSEHRAEPAGRAQSHTDGSGRPVRQFRMNRRERIGNMIVSLLARAGIGPIWLLTTRGRKTSRPRTNPVVPVEQDGRRWLVAPYGAVSWVHNARAAGPVTLRHGRVTRDYVIREVGPEEAAPVLKRYLGIATAARRYFQASKDSPVESFVAVAQRRPVFELTPLSKDVP